jgi:hypothetical protein
MVNVKDFLMENKKQIFILCYIVGLLLLGVGITLLVLLKKFDDELKKKYPLPPKWKEKDRDMYISKVQTSSESAKSSGLIAAGIITTLLGPFIFFMPLMWHMRPR